MNKFESSDVDKGTVKSSKQVPHGKNYFFGLHRAPVFFSEKTQLTIFLPKAKKKLVSQNEFVNCCKREKLRKIILIGSVAKIHS